MEKHQPHDPKEEKERGSTKTLIPLNFDNETNPPTFKNEAPCVPQLQRTFNDRIETKSSNGYLSEETELK